MGYDGAKTALYEAVRELRPRPVIPLVRFEGLAGEFSQHDFGQVDVRYLDRSEERIHFFASRLKYSRWIDVRLVENERVEALVRSLLAGFASFGGIPLVAVFDNPKTVTLGREGGRALWNGTTRSVRWHSTTASGSSCARRRAARRRAVSRIRSGVRERQLLRASGGRCGAHLLAVTLGPLRPCVPLRDPERRPPRRHRWLAERAGQAQSTVAVTKHHGTVGDDLAKHEAPRRVQYRAQAQGQGWSGEDAPISVT